MSTQAVLTDSTKSGAHAIVMGGSIAGLLAARVLSDHFDKVTLVERDRFPDGVETRKGVPQGRHTHGLLNKGQSILSQLFPDLVSALIEGGATTVQAGADLRWHHFGGYKVPFQSDLTGLSMSRSFLDWHIRRRVLALNNLDCIQECDIKELVASSDHTRVTGVKVQRRTGGGGEQILSADLVVDATGRGSQSPRWLESLGYPKPEETVIKVDVGYATRIYRRKPGDVSGAKLLLVYPTPPREKRMGVLFPIEGDRWTMTLAGWLGDHAPTDEQGFLEYARSLPAPDIYNVVKRAEPLTDIFIYRYPANLRRRYEKMARFPEGLIVLGDALCSFNPIYGQGMTVSALDAATLDECLREQRRQRGDLAGFPRRFFNKVSKVIDVPWMFAAGADLMYPEAEGIKVPGTDFLNWYVGKIHQAVTRDPVVSLTFAKVMNLMEPPTSLFSPRIVMRVLAGSMKHRQKSSLVAQTAWTEV